MNDLVKYSDWVEDVVYKAKSTKKPVHTIPFTKVKYKGLDMGRIGRN